MVAVNLKGFGSGKIKLNRIFYFYASDIPAFFQYFLITYDCNMIKVRKVQSILKIVYIIYQVLNYFYVTSI